MMNTFLGLCLGLLTLFSFSVSADEEAVKEEAAKKKINEILLVDQSEVDGDNGVFKQIPERGMLEVLRERDKRVTDAAKSIGELINRSPALQRYLMEEVDRQGNRLVRQQLVKAMGAIKGTWSVEFLIAKLEEEPVNMDAAVSLGEIGGPEATRALRRVLTEKKGAAYKYDYAVRRDAVNALAKCGKTEETVSVLLRVLREDPDGVTVGEAAENLGLFGAEKAIFEMVEIVLNRDFDNFLDGFSARISAVKGLAAIPGKESTVALEKIANEIKNPSLRGTAEFFLDERKKKKK